MNGILFRSVGALVCLLTGLNVQAALVQVEAEDTGQVTQGGTWAAHNSALYSGGILLQPLDVYLGQTLTISFISPDNGSFSVYGTQCADLVCNNGAGTGMPSSAHGSESHWFDIQLDGAPEIPVSTISPDAGFHFQQELFAFTGLSAGAHTVVLTSNPNSQYVQIDYFTYESAVVPVPAAA